MDKRDEMLLRRTNEEKRNIIKVWEADIDKLPDFGQELRRERIDWLESTIETKKKKKKKKKVKRKKKKEE
jgi:hypothetical protein